MYPSRKSGWAGYWQPVSLPDSWNDTRYRHKPQVFAIRIDRLIQKLVEYLAVMNGRFRHREVLHQFVGLVRVYVVLVAVVGFVVLLGPVGLHILLPLLVLGPDFGRPTHLDLGVLFSVVRCWGTRQR